jgi:hypothetical protein
MKKFFENIYIKKESGMTLLTVLILVFLLTSFGVALLAMTNNDTKLSTLQRASSKAFYLAEAGVEQTLYNLNSPFEISGFDLYYRWTEDNPLKGGTSEEYYKVTVENIGVNDPSATPPTHTWDRIKIFSTGYIEKEKYNSASRTIEVIAEIFFTTKTLYEYAVLGDKVILLQGGEGSYATIDGDIHSNDKIENPGSKFGEYYTGNATVAGEVNQVNSSNTNSEYKEIPTVDYEELKKRAFDAGQVFSSYNDNNNWGTEQNPISGIYYIEGDFVLGNGDEVYIKNGTIVVEGKVELKNGSKIIHERTEDYLDPSDRITALAMVAQGDIIHKAKDEHFTADGIIQSILPNGQSVGSIILHNSATINGALIAREVEVKANANISYDHDALSQFTTQGDGLYKKVSWQEI